MLYVFIVSSGTMMKFDMNLAVKKVMELKTEIAKSVNISVEDQVLLCSGGEELKSDNIVGNYYGAGTDTNPIFLFSKNLSEPDLPCPMHLKKSIDLSIEDDVRGCANMTPSTGAATVRSTLAQRFAEAALNGRRQCDELVHEQHLQQQGWAAVIANLEDAKDSLLKRKSRFEDHFQKYLANRSSYQEIIKSFPEDIELLAKVPLLPKLMPHNECMTENLDTKYTLLSWFCSEPKPVLESLAEKCERSLEELNEHCLVVLNEAIQNVLKNADNPDIKEVKGIEERLSSLNKQIEDAKKLEKDQRDLASWFNQTQCMIARDPMVLPDLCGTFQNQLELMLQNHKCLRDILERCTNAKKELSGSINYRINYICRVESEMYDLQVKYIFLQKHVESFVKQIESFRQVHLAPERYLKSLAEVCRRKAFSANYMKWATELSAEAFKTYDKEVSLRKSFNSEESKNMVDNLFPGMDDLPPPFAIECPQPFDQNLPNIVKEDLEWLTLQFPELSHFCEVSPPEPMPCISQAETDSAFSSNIPLSRVVGDSSSLGDKSHQKKDEIYPHKLAAPAGDYSSLPSEYASLPNEVFSLTSSPFEDPLLPSSEMEVNLKRTKTSSQHSGLLSGTFGKSEFPEDGTVAGESDGEEFETVERYGTSPVDICTQLIDSKRSVSGPRPTSSSDVIAVNKSRDKHQPKISKARSDGDAISPIQERLKSSESLLVSGDFQSTEYYIDDSMPSSYTESNATSPLLRGNRMVKSHHVVLAELQKQVEEKTGALIGATKFIQELQGSFRSDLSNLKTFVKEEFWERMSEVSQIVENINSCMANLQQQILLEKEEAVKAAKAETASLENSYKHRLEVENQKLNDAETQISNYEKRLREVSSSFEELRHEKIMLEDQLRYEKKIAESTVLEHEIELDCLRNDMTHAVQERDEEILELKEKHMEIENEKDLLQKKTECLEAELQKKLQEGLIMSSTLAQKEAELLQMIKEQAVLQEEIKRLQESKTAAESLAKVEKELELSATEKKQCMEKLKETSQKLSDLQSEFEKSKEELNKLEKLNSQHTNAMESLRSRYRLAVSATSLERLPSVRSLESIDSEALIGPKEQKKIISEKHSQWEIEKNENLKVILEEEKRKLQEAVEEERQKQERIRQEMIENMRKDHESKIEKMKARFTAEKQVSFNEAINKLAKEKDAVIEDLRVENSSLQENVSSICKYLETPLGSVYNYEALTVSDSALLSSSKEVQFGCFLEKIREDLGPYLKFKPAVEKPVSSSSDTQQTMESLKKKLHKKEKECQELTAKFAALYKSGSGEDRSCLDCKNKISILTCNVGDLVLLCYEERNENFKVFHFGSFVHFLHQDSLQALNLKIPAESSEKWALGIVVNKEFCVTKKPNNRYKLVLGTKFYRVKVQPWNRDLVLFQSISRSRQTGSTYFISKNTPLQTLSSDDGDGTRGSGSMSTSAI
ncbi:RB1-inducible coiled-coil protein 1-like isoform X2 [Stegodyphus dumicola]|uniref:RB1-inducible coiled-coil protein 1-like isoform X2 n=1 Tax=Stegodyphus dumicola TaxID=202533 RepID=UPI0015AA7B37|nr:RB1-inducible coiled-coil protein 1-like isoform X2 [Stegodyphus dumicola]